MGGVDYVCGNSKRGKLLLQHLIATSDLLYIIRTRRLLRISACDC